MRWTANNNSGSQQTAAADHVHSTTHTAHAHSSTHTVRTHDPAEHSEIPQAHHFGAHPPFPPQDGDSCALWGTT